MRIRSRWSEKGVQLADQCPSCAPGSFEKFVMPSDQKIWMGYEAHPNEYVKAPDGGYDRKPEYRAEQEQTLCESTEEEREIQAKAEAHKRQTRRTRPMNFSELGQAVKVAEHYAERLRESTNDA